MNNNTVSVNDIRKAIAKHNQEYNKKLKIKIENGEIVITDTMPKKEVINVKSVENKKMNDAKKELIKTVSNKKETKPKMKSKVNSSMTGKQYLESIGKKVKDLSGEEKKEYEKLRKRNYRMRKKN